MGGHNTMITADIFSFVVVSTFRFSDRMKVFNSNIFPLFSDQRTSDNQRIFSKATTKRKSQSKFSWIFIDFHTKGQFVQIHYCCLWLKHVSITVKCWIWIVKCPQNCVKSNNIAIFHRKSQFLSTFPILFSKLLFLWWFRCHCDDDIMINSKLNISISNSLSIHSKLCNFGAWMSPQQLHGSLKCENLKSFSLNRH